MLLLINLHSFLFFISFYLTENDFWSEILLDVEEKVL